jgi:hypothetical protein
MAYSQALDQSIDGRPAGTVARTTLVGRDDAFDISAFRISALMPSFRPAFGVQRSAFVTCRLSAAESKGTIAA